MPKEGIPIFRPCPVEGICQTIQAKSAPLDKRGESAQVQFMTRLNEACKNKDTADDIRSDLIGNPACALNPENWQHLPKATQQRLARAIEPLLRV